MPVVGFGGFLLLSFLPKLNFQVKTAQSFSTQVLTLAHLYELSTDAYGIRRTQIQQKYPLHTSIYSNIERFNGLMLVSHSTDELEKMKPRQICVFCLFVLGFFWKSSVLTSSTWESTQNAHFRIQPLPCFFPYQILISTHFIFKYVTNSCSSKFSM